MIIYTGLGKMGSAMSKNFVKAGLNLVVYDVDKSARELVASYGKNIKVAKRYILLLLLLL